MNTKEKVSAKRPPWFSAANKGPNWRVRCGIWAGGFVLAGLWFVLCVAVCFSLEDHFVAARHTPPVYVLPMVPLCMFVAASMAVACLLAAIPAAPGQGLRRAVGWVELVTLLVLVAVGLLFLVYVQGITGNAPLYLWQWLAGVQLPVV